MKVYRDLQSWIEDRGAIVKKYRDRGMGFVPTMGALHEGHLSLFRHAKSENAILLASIFVNPTQFNNADDFEKYPSKIDADLALAERAGCDIVLLPTKEDVYPDGYKYRVSESEFSKVLCGAHRPGHFDGVLTIVLKLFQITQASHSYFGQKDFQQLELIRSMAKAFFLDIKVLGLPTIREADGLAMSSRNLRLKPEDRKKAAQISKLLRQSFLEQKGASFVAAELTKNGFRVDYVEDHLTGPSRELRRFVAAFLGDVRLIDNMTAAENADDAARGPK
jgi:pantoate--beta-alanine ligase